MSSTEWQHTIASGYRNGNNTIAVKYFYLLHSKEIKLCYVYLSIISKIATISF